MFAKTSHQYYELAKAQKLPLEVFLIFVLSIKNCVNCSGNEVSLNFVYLW